MVYFIKNMVCNRCILAVKNLFEKAHFPPVRISLGEVETTESIPEEQLHKLRSGLIELGFEMMDDAKGRIIEKIKNVIIQLVHHTHEELTINHSDYIASKLNKDYSYLSSLFSEIEGITIEKYFILQKIEKVKELLVYNELTLSEIADKLGYSSVSYLSGQFKKITGLTPSHFKQIKESRRKPLDEV